MKELITICKSYLCYSLCIFSSQFYEPLAKNDNETEIHFFIEGSLATEMCLVTLDTLDIIIQVASASEIHHNLLGVVLKVLLHALARNQSTLALQNLFAMQRSLIFKFHNLLFDDESDSCADLCLLLLKHCGSQLPSIRSQAAASLYLLMRQNFEIGNVGQTHTDKLAHNILYLLDSWACDASWRHDCTAQLSLTMCR